MSLNTRELYQKIRPARIMAGVLCVLFTAGTVASAADPAPADSKPAPKSSWESAATLGVTLTRGNSKTFAAGGNVTTRRLWTHDEALFGASAGYGQSSTTVNGNKIDQTTESYVKGYGQWNHLFSPQTYAGVRVTGDHDDIASLAYRLTVSPLAGYYFVKQTNAFLAGEVGPSYVREKFFHAGVKDYIGLRVGERGERKFHSGARIWETLEWIPKVEDMNNYLVNAEAGVSAPISKALSLSLILQDTYKNVPAVGKLKNDLKLIAGLSYTF
jgi:hypothetical protein